MMCDYTPYDDLSFTFDVISDPLDIEQTVSELLDMLSGQYDKFEPMYFQQDIDEFYCKRVALVMCRDEEYHISREAESGPCDQCVEGCLNAARVVFSKVTGAMQEQAELAYDEEMRDREYYSTRL